MNQFGGLKRGNYKNINGFELGNLIKNNNNVLILDVRSVGEYRHSHIPGAKNIPLEQIKNQMHNLQVYKNYHVVVYCGSGVRSMSVSQFLLQYGFLNIYNLAGGIGSYRGNLR